MKKTELWGIVLFVFVFVVIGFIVPCRHHGDMDHAIIVQGDGEVYATPDTMILSLRVEETAPTTAEAQKTVDEKVVKIKEILQNYSIKSSDIKSTNVNVYESFDWRESGRVSLGYTASHNLEVKVRSANNENEGIAGKILSEISQIGGVLINNISYDIYDKSVFYSEARKLAMEKAYQKASELAELGNVRLGKPISIQENKSYDYAVSRMAMKNAAFGVMEESVDMDDGADISLGEMKLSLDVSVSYAIK